MSDKNLEFNILFSSKKNYKLGINLNLKLKFYSNQPT